MDFQKTTRQFINTTDSHIFLTGKAGTGKTTFLKNLKDFTHKPFIVVAPTGVAALNAGGVTIHSQFLLPFGMFLPARFEDDSVSNATPFYTQNLLARKHPLNATRKQVLRSIDLLVIDEVSMLRADIVDAIDYRMKAARGNFQESFGGVQVLFIGDLHQLPPVVKRDEESLMDRYYKSPWFYEAKAFEQNPLVFIEFNKIFRQQDDTFISLLNNVRNNIITDGDIHVLNTRYKTPEEINSLNEVVTLTTHNYKADSLNKKMLSDLPGKPRTFTAVIEGDFPESMYPVLYELELKIGAQIMFVRNDPDGAYFNGKLATVKEFNGSDVWVEMAETHVRYKLKRERWENKKYTLQEDTRDLDEDIVGSFEQYPVKLAWAITVHKSQGLTFDKAIVDVAEAFADGQVYVALSRLRWLDGLILRSKVKPGVISTDKNVEGFVKTNHRPDALNDVMRERQKTFLRKIIQQTFDLSVLVKELLFVIKSNAEGQYKDEVRSALQKIIDALNAEKTNTEKFKAQLGSLLDSDKNFLVERMKKGSEYYANLLCDQLKSLLGHRQQMMQHKRVKTYLNDLASLDVVITKKINAIDKVTQITSGILNNDSSFTFDDLSSQRVIAREQWLKEFEIQYPPEAKKKKTRKKKDGEDSTYSITLKLFKEGLTVKQIAETRGLVTSTIEGHLAKFVEDRAIDIFSFMDQSAIDEIIAVATKNEEASFSDLYFLLKRKYSHGLIKAALFHARSGAVSEKD